jgi:hypothetical protein
MSRERFHLLPTVRPQAKAEEAVAVPCTIIIPARQIALLELEGIDDRFDLDVDIIAQRDDLVRDSPALEKAPVVIAEPG